MKLTPRDRTTDGFTLLEALVTILILAVAFTTISWGLFANVRNNSDVRLKNEVARLSETYMEKYREMKSFGTQRDDITETVDVFGRSLTVVTDYCPTDLPPAMPCDNNSVFIRLTILNGEKVIQKTETYYTDMDGS